MSKVSERLASAGVFLGAEGLEGLLGAGQFWDSQSYGTRLYYGSGGADYLHRDVLRAAVKTIEEDAAEIERLRAQVRELQIAVLAERERCAKACEEARPHGGRAWTEAQHSCFIALTHVAEFIRSAP